VEDLGQLLALLSHVWGWSDEEMVRVSVYRCSQETERNYSHHPTQPIRTHPSRTPAPTPLTVSLYAIISPL
jgi:hypothetical protein